MSRARRPVKRSRPGDERLPTSWEWLPPGVERREHRSAARQAQPAQSAQSPALIAPAGVAAALNPRCPHPGIAVPGGLLGVAVGRLDRVVDIDERQHLGAALCVASRARKRAATASSWRTWPKVNVRRTSRASMAPEPPRTADPSRRVAADPAREHPADQRRHLLRRARPALVRDGQVLVDQGLELAAPASATTAGPPHDTRLGSSDTADSTWQTRI